MSTTQHAGAGCAECGAALAADQRYCLACGARAGDRDPRLQELLAPLRSGAPAAVAASAVAPASAPSFPARAPRSRARRLARPLLSIWLPLALVFFGFGIVLGGAASPSVQTTLAASSSQAAAPAAPSSEGSSAGAAGSGEGSKPGASAASSEAPTSEEEASPPAATSTRAATKQSVKKSKSSAGSGSSSSEGGSSESSSQQGGGSTLPAVKHVFLIMLSDQPYASVFGPSSAAPYLAHTLEKSGELLVRYYAVAHEQLANEIALLSGQGPTPQTAANCAVYEDVETPGAMQAGSGCVYPRTTQTLMSQLAGKHLSSRAYVQGLDEAGRGACVHPVIGAADPTAALTAAAGAYATFRNPFVYFRSVTDVASCKSEDVGLEQLSRDLSSPSRTPSFSYIAPDRCHDGNPQPCSPSAPAGLPAADGFLRQVVPKILASKGYKQGGLLVITVDEAPSSGELADSSSCCGQPHFAVPSAAGAGAGGGQVGAVLLSRFVKAGSTSQEPYNHFSMLRTIEDLFGLSHLGYAAGAKVNALEPSLLSAKGG